MDGLSLLFGRNLDINKGRYFRIRNRRQQEKNVNQNKGSIESAIVYKNRWKRGFSNRQWSFSTQKMYSGMQFNIHIINLYFRGKESLMTGSKFLFLVYIKDSIQSQISIIRFRNDFKIRPHATTNVTPIHYWIRVIWKWMKNNLPRVAIKVWGRGVGFPDPIYLIFNIFKKGEFS